MFSRVKTVITQPRLSVNRISLSVTESETPALWIIPETRAFSYSASEVRYGIICANNPINFIDPWGLLTQAQYDSLVQVLAIEQELGTHEAARRISNTFSHPNHQALLQVFNADSGNDSMVNGVDIDWFTDLTSVSEARFPGFVEAQYIVGKSYWSISRRAIGYPNGNPWPFQDPGERAAVRKAALGRHYSDFITPEYLEKERPDNDCK